MTPSRIPDLLTMVNGLMIGMEWNGSYLTDEKAHGSENDGCDIQDKQMHCRSMYEALADYAADINNCSLSKVEMTNDQPPRVHAEADITFKNPVELNMDKVELEVQKQTGGVYFQQPITIVPSSSSNVQSCVCVHGIYVLIDHIQIWVLLPLRQLNQVQQALLLYQKDWNGCLLDKAVPIGENPVQIKVRVLHAFKSHIYIDLGAVNYSLHQDTGGVFFEPSSYVGPSGK
ncbi:unnamed protein product [Echinostoma caproni]|uniref:VWFD domain-containing protein n=1 Tax=Echinostoma caproni TaxID=27848 RepID=A0A183ABC9_9TREM|nr:unnamed protein product [Echinostoma caproni]